jgi:hypothetical protein
VRIGRVERMWAADELRPAVGWKVWSVERDGADTRLRSVLYGDPWLPGEPIQATCRRILHSEHEAPCAGCGCGIHAGRELSAWEHYLAVEPRTRVFGRVLLWGATIEGREGWRAARACPVEIFVPEAVEDAREVAVDLAAPYGVPVHVLEPFVLEHEAVAR